MMNLPEEKQDSTYDFEFTKEIKDALSIAPSRGGGGGDSVASSVSRLRTSYSHSSVKSFNHRPWTAVDGDAFSVASTSMSNLVSTRGKNGSGASNSGKQKNNKSPSDVAKGLESQIDRLIEQTVLLKKEAKFEEALESAKEASKKEQLLRKHRKANSLSENDESELMYSTWFNLATAYESSDEPDEALKVYTYLAKQRGNPFTGRLRINMGNIYYAQQKYPSAIKMYKMALDQTRKDAHKIRRNIGNSFFRMGKIRDAVKNYDEAMNAAPDFQTGFNLLVCRLALGDIENMKRDFRKLVEIPMADGDGRLTEDILIDEANTSQEANREMDTRTKEANHFLLTAARLIAPMLDSDDWSAGYDWVSNALEERHEELAVQMKLELATQRLKRKDVGAAVKMMKTLQKKDKRANAATATNLSFVSFLEGNIERASNYADIALGSDRYNAKALVNKANCLFVSGDFTLAKDLYLEAIGVQADCVQAIFNLGLANAQLGLAEEAIHAFQKAHKISNNPQVVFQIADIYELSGRSHDAMKWFNVLAARVPSDPANLTRLGQLYAEAKDESQGLHYQLESFRHYPIDLDIISWIGTWFVQQEMYEKSCYFFQQAALVQPKEIKWGECLYISRAGFSPFWPEVVASAINYNSLTNRPMLFNVSFAKGFMVASAHKRCDKLEIAFHEYEKLHDQFPDNVECLRHLVATTKQLGKPSFRYEDKLDKLL